MRTIKCRGYCTETQRWVIGSLITYKNGETYIVEHEDEEVSFKVMPNTVGQFTEQTDIKGNEIYDGDTASRGGRLTNCIVRYNQDMARWYFETRDIRTPLTKDEIKGYELTIIGNIYDNPELIKTN